MTSEERRELKKKRLEKFRKSSDAIRPADAALLYPSVSIDFFYDHWAKDLGGKIIKNGRKAIYMPVSRDKIERYLGISSQPTAEYFMNMTPEEIPQVANVFMPYLLNSLFENLQKFAYEKYYTSFSKMSGPKGQRDQFTVNNVQNNVPNDYLRSPALPYKSATKEESNKNKERDKIISEHLTREGQLYYEASIALIQTGKIGKWIDEETGKAMLAVSGNWGDQLDVLIIGEWHEELEERKKMVLLTLDKMVKGNDELIKIEKSL